MMRQTDNKSENDSFSIVGDLNGELSENERGGYADGNASIHSLTGWGANNSSSALQTWPPLVEQATDGTKEKAINHPPWQKITRKQMEFPFPQQTEK